MELRRVCVYCSSASSREVNVEREIRNFGREITQRGIALVYGGSSRGLMGALADEVLASGGRVIGVIPRALEGREAAHRGLTELKVVGTMHVGGLPVFNLGGWMKNTRACGFMREGPQARLVQIENRRGSIYWGHALYETAI